MIAYHNEIEPYAAQWLRNLIAAGHIAPGEVDERSIVEVQPDDLRGFTQCHFFAGSGGWSFALRLAGWPDDRPIWTGSCPCQPFSAAGKQKGFEDPRHLWPEFFRLIRACRPGIVLGEQVARRAGYAWWDAVATDLEGEGYTCRAADIGAHSVGAPHLRQRLYWMADREIVGRREECADAGRRGEGDGAQGRAAGLESSGDIGGMADADARPERLEPRGGGCVGEGRAQHDAQLGLGRGGEVGGMELAAWAASLWRDLEWLYCSDGKARPTKPGLFPLAHGIPGRVGRLRAYGNAIVPQVAAAFIQTL